VMPESATVAGVERRALRSLRGVHAVDIGARSLSSAPITIYGCRIPAQDTIVKYTLFET
jgi:hypothetical protein